MNNFNENLSEEVVNELIKTGAWDRFGINVNEAAECDKEEAPDKEAKAVKKDKLKNKLKDKGKEDKDSEDDGEDEEMEESVKTHNCPLCRSELEEGLDREDIDIFSEALRETYEAEYESELDEIVEAISELDEDELDEYLQSVDESLLEDIADRLPEEDEE